MFCADTPRDVPFCPVRHPMAAAASAKETLTVPFPKLTQSERSVPVAEGALLWARNKWLLAHPDSPEAAAGTFVGLTGENLRLW